MTKKIVSGVVKFQEQSPEGNIIDKVRVHYTDNSMKEFKVIDWEMTMAEGRRLWKKHEKSFTKEIESFD
tara:strand:- start:103 stop:309 length:207 start_codon:yes stop_codon:yes gene_type:complete